MLFLQATCSNKACYKGRDSVSVGCPADALISALVQPSETPSSAATGSAWLIRAAPGLHSLQQGASARAF